MIGAAVGGDNEVALEVGADRLHQDMDLSLLAFAAGGVADHPAHGVARRHGDELLPGFQGDVSHLVDGGIELVEGTLGVGVDLDRIDVAVLDWLDAGRSIRPDDTVLGRSLIFELVCDLADRLELTRQRQGFGHLDHFEGAPRLRLALGRLNGRAVQDRDLRDLDAGGAGTKQHRRQQSGHE